MNGRHRTLPDLRYSFGALALFVVLTALSPWNYALAFLLLVPLYVLVRAWPWSRTLANRRLLWAALASITVIVALVVPPMLPYPGAGGAGGGTHSLLKADKWNFIGVVGIFAVAVLAGLGLAQWFAEVRTRWEQWLMSDHG